MDPGAQASAVRSAQPHRLRAGPGGYLAGTRQKGGDCTGPNPCDRGRPRSKHLIITEGQGIPLAVGLTAAKVSDMRCLEPLLDAVQPIARPVGRPRKTPAKLYADKGLGSSKT